MKLVIINPSKISLLKNFSYLSIFNLVHLLEPLVTLPFLLKTLGTEVYGAVVFAQAICRYLEILVQFGFGITAISEVSKNRNDKEMLSKIVSTILVTKFSLFLFVSIIIAVIDLFSKKLANYPFLLWTTLWICLYQALFLNWYFQGIEKMKFITLSDFVLRVTFITLIFCFVRSPNDYMLVPLFNGIGCVLSLLLMFFIVFRIHKVKFIVPTTNMIFDSLKESYPIFLSQISQFYSKLNRVLIGVVLGFAEVAIYDLVEKVINVFKMPITIIGQVIFPRIANSKDKHFILRGLKYSVLINIFLVIVLWKMGHYLVSILVKDLSIVNSVHYLLKILSFTLLLVTVNVFMGRNTLYVFGYKNKYVLSVMLASCSYIVSNCYLYLSGRFSLTSVTITILIAEVTTLISSMYFVYKYKIFRVSSFTSN